MRRRPADPDRQTAHNANKTLERVNALAWLLDGALRLPGGFRIGIDAVIGLLPFLGDAAGVVLSGYIVRQAARLGAPPSLLLRMAFNVAVDGLIGMIPLVGDIFDAAWKANLRNARLLQRHLENPRHTARSSRLFVACLLIIMLAFMLLMSWLWMQFVLWAWHQLGH